MKNNLIAYAGDFVSFLIERINVFDIKRIILFGSVARGEASAKSDVDLFIDIAGNKKSVESNVKKIKEKFLKSKRYQDYWVLKNIKNEIKPIVGRLDKWKELKTSIISNGVVLYGKFEEVPKDAEHRTLMCWENVKPESKRVLLSKRLFGYRKGRKKYKGLIQKYDCEKIGKGIVSVPPESAGALLKLFRSMKVAVRIKKILEFKKT